MKRRKGYEFSTLGDVGFCYIDDSDEENVKYLYWENEDDKKKIVKLLQSKYGAMVMAKAIAEFVDDMKQAVRAELCDIMKVVDGRKAEEL